MCQLSSSLINRSWDTRWGPELSPVPLHGSDSPTRKSHSAVLKGSPPPQTETTGRVPSQLVACRCEPISILSSVSLLGLESMAPVPMGRPLREGRMHILPWAYLHFWSKESICFPQIRVQNALALALEWDGGTWGSKISSSLCLPRVQTTFLTIAAHVLILSLFQWL